jgi:diketogulonate reductase-like aldo/keto reductase
MFITTKVWLSNYGYETTIDSVKDSLTKLKTDYIDLMLLHAPGDPKLRPEAWRALEECHRQGLVKDIGVSNFGEKHLEKLAETSTIPPAVNQLEIHPFLQRKDLVKYCKEHNIVVEAYSPLAKAHKLTDPTVAAIAHRVGATPAQVMIAWSLSKGLVPLPKSVNPERQHQNLQAASVILSDGDIKQLDGLEEGLVTGWDPVTQDPV